MLEIYRPEIPRKRNPLPVIIALAIGLAAGILIGIFVGRNYFAPQKAAEEEAAIIAEKEAEEKAKKEAEEKAKKEEQEAGKLTRTPVKVRGVYLSGWTAGSDKIDDIIKMLDETELNAVVIDVKNDDGFITYKMDTPSVVSYENGEAEIKDIDALLQKLHDHGVYVIGRIVTFRDPVATYKNPEMAVKNKDGSIFEDPSGLSWLNPYSDAARKYVIEVAEGAADSGFDEIQFDYVRFSAADRMATDVDLQETPGVSKQDMIVRFINEAVDALHKKNVFVSIDVFGTIMASTADAEKIGQDYARMAQSADYICPMIYPSHYADGYGGIEHPDTQPYDMITIAMEESEAALSAVPANDSAIIRPYLQAFTASYLSNFIDYGPEQIRQQMQALYDKGYEEWILWNASNNYDQADFEPEQ